MDQNKPADIKRKEFHNQTGEHWHDYSGTGYNPNYLEWLENTPPVNPGAQLRVKGSVEHIQDTNYRGFFLEVEEYGEIVRQYHDTDYSRFMDVAREIIQDHLEHHSEQESESSNQREVRNVQIHYYTL